MNHISRRRALGVLASSLGWAFNDGCCAASAKEAAFECPATGSQHPDLRPFDDLMRDCVQRGAPGVSIAVSRRSRLVYARGFGFSDCERRLPVTPATLFRIASVSKPITAVAVLQLVERKMLDLNSPVHALLQLDEPSDRRWKQITVLQLLRHTAGWDRGKSFDPMFRPRLIAKEFQVPPPAGPAHIIRYMLRQPLDFDPGTRVAYSNFGYCLLGRVIERAAGAPYPQYVQQNVLRPLGIRRMQMGRTLRAERAPDEATYYDPEKKMVESAVAREREMAPRPYGSFYLEAMDSHGGWIASPVDLLRFAAAFDSPARCKVLNPASVAAMFAPPEGSLGLDERGQPKLNYYACGWDVWNYGPGGMNTWHNGALCGTSSILVRRRDGLNWAVVFNADRWLDGKNMVMSIDGALHRAADAVKKWPAIDLFHG